MADVSPYATIRIIPGLTRSVKKSRQETENVSYYTWRGLVVTWFGVEIVVSGTIFLRSQLGRAIAIRQGYNLALCYTS
jgi:hypothetical protein